MARSNLVDIEVEVIYATEKAWLLKSADTGVQDWFPRSWGELEEGKSQGYGVLTTEQSKAEDKRFV